MSTRRMNPAKSTYRMYAEAPAQDDNKPMDTGGGLMRSLQRSMKATESKELQPKDKAIGIWQAIHEARMRHKNGGTA